MEKARFAFHAFKLFFLCVVIFPLLTFSSELKSCCLRRDNSGFRVSAAHVSFRCPSLLQGRRPGSPSYSVGHMNEEPKKGFSNSESL